LYVHDIKKIALVIDENYRIFIHNKKQGVNKFTVALLIKRRYTF